MELLRSLEKHAPILTQHALRDVANNSVVRSGGGTLDCCVKALPSTDLSKDAKSATPDFSTYAPVRIACPKRDEWVRPAHGLSTEESTWVSARKKKVLTGLSGFLRRLHLSDFDTEEYLRKISCEESNIPTFGMAISGGGWSSGLTGAGPWLAFDDRVEDSNKHRTGGLLQSMSYLSGLSGGSWCVMSLATNNFPIIEDMVASWHVDVSPIYAPNKTAHRVPAADLFKQIIPKFEAGFNVSIADLTGRAFAYEFVAGAHGGMETMMSDIATLSNFQDHEMPFPMWQAAQGTTNEILGIEVPYYNATIFEWNPLEFGAWYGPSAFFPTKYLGTKVIDGKPVDDQCVVGFDRASWGVGVAANALSFWQIETTSNGTLGSFPKRSLDAAHAKRQGPLSPPANPEDPVWFSQSGLDALEDPFKKYLNYTLNEMFDASVPNPFASSSSTSDKALNPVNITLLDGTEGGQTLPLWSQIQPARKPEFIIAWDANEDSLPYLWTNGTNLHNTYLYATNLSVPFPIVPSATTFVNRDLTSKPVMFGCDAELTNMNDTRSPIVLYMAKAPYSAYINYTWTYSEFSNEQMAVILTNGYNQATAGNGTLDAEWPECLGCAVIDRSLSKMGMERTKQCQECMNRYCWDGVEDNSPPGLVDPPLALDPSLSFAEWNKSTTAEYWAEVS